MKNYTKVNIGQAYDTIGREIEGQIKTHPTHELRFVRVPGTEALYAAYALQHGKNSPRLDRYEFIDAVERSELVEVLNGISSLHLPKEVRVIQPNWARKSWGVFFKR